MNNQAAQTMPAPKYRPELGVYDEQSLRLAHKAWESLEYFANELAAAIAILTNTDIGEHSSMNCPWRNALQAAEEYKPSVSTAHR